MTPGEYDGLLRRSGPDAAIRLYTEVADLPETLLAALRRGAKEVYPLRDKSDIQQVHTLIESSIEISLENAPLNRNDHKVHRNRQSLYPPINAEFLFYFFLDEQNCDALVGDLEERFKLMHKKFGKGKADFWYWTQAIRSVGPVMLAWMKKVSLKPVIGVIGWAIAKGLLGHDSWLAALVELYRRIRS
jgi:hypothetical protein